MCLSVRAKANERASAEKKSKKGPAKRALMLIMVALCIQVACLNCCCCCCCSFRPVAAGTAAAAAGCLALMTPLCVL